ncbi:hypothetical protein C8R47DRAFT_569376 [Mycena vitilis]|nr:hypothetical protein C8R47DRAFT_569376 [Mycena vitilis]
MPPHSVSAAPWSLPLARAASLVLRTQPRLHGESLHRFPQLSRERARGRRRRPGSGRTRWPTSIATAPWGLMHLGGEPYARLPFWNASPSPHLRLGGASPTQRPCGPRPTACQLRPMPQGGKNAQPMSPTPILLQHHHDPHSSSLLNQLNSSPRYSLMVTLSLS